MSETAVLEPEVIPPSVTRMSETETLARRYESQADGDLAEAHATQITDDASYLQAGELRLRIDANKKRAEAVVSAFCDPLYQHWKKMRGWLVPSVEKRQEAMNILGRGMLTYQDTQARKRREAEQKAQEEARKEQERLERLAEEKAQRAEAKGDMARAEAIRESVPLVVPPREVSIPAPPVVKGLTTKSYWRAEVTDLAALVTACAAGEVPLEAVQPNDVLLGQTARALKSALKWPGVRVWEDKGLAGTGR